MAVKRKRDKTLTIRVTEKEKSYIQNRAKKAGLSITDYMVRLSRETPIYVPQNMQPFLLELKRIGNNINQLTQKVNVGAFSSYNLAEFIEEFKRLNDCIGEVGRNNKWQP